MWEQKAEKKRNKDKWKKLETRLTPIKRAIWTISVPYKGLGENALYSLHSAAISL